MAVSSSSSSRLLLLLFLISSLSWGSNRGSALLMDRDGAASSAPYEPHFTECVSRNQETFQCWWSPGGFHNLSSPGALRVFYLKRNSGSLVNEWKECPKYIHSNRECFFDKNHTSVWTTYCMQLRSQNVTYSDQDYCFFVENIVRPDPPVSLNWTLLNISPSGLSYDVIVNWEPPPSADVKAGWMRIEYEIQYRERNSTTWEALEVQRHTHQTIYGLTIGKDYEVHIRCRMQAFQKFGEFSDSIFIEVTEVPSRESPFSLTVALVFGAVSVLLLLVLVAALMKILLPPVPAPKIKGIDPELLKKGKLDELSFILSSGGMGGLPSYAPVFYQDEPWVEFIEVEGEEGDSPEKLHSQDSDTQKLLGLPVSVSHGMNQGGSGTNSIPHDDSGHNSFYDPELLNPDTQVLMGPLLPSQGEDQRSPSPDTSKTPGVPAQPGTARTWVNTDFYAQVSNVMPSGGVVLSPGQQLRIQESLAAAKVEAQKKANESQDAEDAKEKKEVEQLPQLLLMDPEGSGYTTESSARQFYTPPCSPEPVEGSKATNARAAPAAEHQQSPYLLPDSPQTQVLAPVADYTVVQELDSQHSLLLNPPPRPSPPPAAPRDPLKALPAMPVGYVTPDLLSNLSP
uniref:Growth hormone receptor n=1 Tax=Tetraodon nigroviridis TaxID=99883 RepID=Q6UAQ0_TETNG|nr:class I helical cytokine receptor number 6 [Tetraodon nigroviridis]